MTQLIHFDPAGTLGRSASEFDALFAETERRIQKAHANHLGYPYNLSRDTSVPSSLGHYLINNLGDPYHGSHYASEVCALEREAVGWLMELWGCVDPDDYWGSVGTSGTEGNLWGIYLGREAFPDAVLLHSTEAHYSIPKAARILRMPSISIACDESGEINIDALSLVLQQLAGRPAVVALTCGTTMKGAHDDIGSIISRLDAAGITQDHRYIHVDGALNAMVIPFVSGAPDSIKPSFGMAIDSISTSGHKMIGTAMPCGILVARRSHVVRVATEIAYLRSNDTTLMGSRNGHAVLAVWSRLFGRHKEGFAKDVEDCLLRTDSVVGRLRSNGVPVLCNPFSLTVVFPQPAENLVNFYQLACYRDQAHAVIMPNVTEALVDRFVGQYLEWWDAAPENCHGDIKIYANGAGR